MRQPQPNEDRVSTLADRAERLIQADIISGALAPRERLALPTLEKRYNIGLTPMREALSRLSAQGLVTNEGNKGFRVAMASMEDLVDLTRTRVVIETAALKLSMEARLPQWEDNLVAATHRLIRTIERMSGSISDNIDIYEEAHKVFHTALVAGCGAARLIALQRELYDQAYRYRRLMARGGMDPVKAVEEHRYLSELALGNDVHAASAALENHLALTLEAVAGKHDDADDSSA
ncbi:FCD domain-containing protein [Rhizobium sp. RU36D]|uniref:GntR family transcriptional regulator n=1 Tax=Rhizobium sp. RU36D TaxID=1907415 RepID=UPI0009D913BE|nr:FCD domain-containing protein [Rhizobium sp. RU36D]SMC75745.1 transcriptional regulator, GntR family [Rhizobium sp. RU36D]